MWAKYKPYIINPKFVQNCAEGSRTFVSSPWGAATPSGSNLQPAARLQPVFGQEYELEVGLLCHTDCSLSGLEGSRFWAWQEADYEDLMASMLDEAARMDMEHADFLDRAAQAETADIVQAHLGSAGMEAETTAGGDFDESAVWCPVCRQVILSRPLCRRFRMFSDYNSP